MHLAKVIGDVVVTRKDESLIGLKLLILQPLTPERQPAGRLDRRVRGWPAPWPVDRRGDHRPRARALPKHRDGVACHRRPVADGVDGGARRRCAAPRP